MNKKGLTILELIISLALVSVVVLLLIKVLFSLDKINQNDNIASDDEIKRTEITRIIESDFLNLKLEKIDVKKNNNSSIITFKYKEEERSLVINKNKLTYNNLDYKLESKNATYDTNFKYKYIDLEDDYYLIEITIPVLINNKNTSVRDDIILTYINK